MVIVQSSELISVWFCEKNVLVTTSLRHMWAGLPWGCRQLAVSGARLPSIDGLVVRCIKMHYHVKSAITICLQFISNMFRLIRVYQHTEAVFLCLPTKSSVVRDL